MCIICTISLKMFPLRFAEPAYSRSLPEVQPYLDKMSCNEIALSSRSLCFS